MSFPNTADPQLFYNFKNPNIINFIIQINCNSIKFKGMLLGIFSKLLKKLLLGFFHYRHGIMDDADQ